MVTCGFKNRMLELVHADFPAVNLRNKEGRDFHSYLYNLAASSDSPRLTSLAFNGRPLASRPLAL